MLIIQELPAILSFINVCGCRPWYSPFAALQTKPGTHFSTGFKSGGNPFFVKRYLMIVWLPVLKNRVYRCFYSYLKLVIITRHKYLSSDLWRVVVVYSFIRKFLTSRYWEPWKTGALVDYITVQILNRWVCFALRLHCCSYHANIVYAEIKEHLPLWSGKRFLYL